MGYDEIIVELGDFGRYQRIIYVLICLTSMPVAFHKLAGVFLLAKPKFRCALSNETNQSFELTEELSQLAYPPYEKCERYELEYDIGNESFHRLSNETQSCNRFIYDRSRYANSAVTEFDLMELERNLEWKLEREQEEKHLKEQGKDQLKEQERRLQLEKEKQLNLDLNLKLKQKEHEQDQEDQVASAAKPASVWDLFHYPNLRRKTLVIFFDWLVCTGVYYGLSWSPNNLGGNVLLNFVISGAVEIPAYCFLLLTLNRWGRRSILCGCMLLAGISLLATILVPVKMQWLMITFAMLGKLAITGSYGTIYLFSSEQFPTVVRTVGMGAASMVSRLTGMLAPYLNALASIWRPLPLVIYGVLALSAGFLSLLLPETHNKPTLETIADGERFGRREKSSRRDLEKGRELETQPLNLSNGNKA
ncbi:GH14183 [Drosophila grimshawi]|uniref:GH14183 n=1 Tax=Drosophila grimshawi TaxID=7222 RepID=B4JXW3_DROGR|nr:GH14183 [Drosophila grimshawi]